MAFSTADTIVAIATPPGRGGIGVVRLSGPDAVGVGGGLITHGAPLAPGYATLPTIRLRDASDDVPLCASSDRTGRAVATFLPAPPSYTGEDVVELRAHGSPVVLR